MKVLVTGAKGFVGRHVSSYLMEKGFDVLETDIEGTDVSGDVADRDFVFKRLAELNFDAIVHLAAIADIKETVKDVYGCFRVNSFGTLNMLQLANVKDIQRFVYASSANVYGVPKELPVKETTAFNPRVPYDYSKVVAENLVRSFHQHKGLPTVTLRSWKLFGEYEPEDKVVPRFIKACLENKPIPLYNEGKDTTDPYYVKNYCRAVELSLTRSEAVGEAFNVGTGRQLSVREIAKVVKRLIGSSSKLQLLPPRSREEAEPMRSYPSIEKIRSKLGYQPTVGLEEGLQRTIRWLYEKLKAQGLSC